MGRSGLVAGFQREREQHSQSCGGFQWYALIQWFGARRVDCVSCMCASSIVTESFFMLCLFCFIFMQSLSLSLSLFRLFLLSSFSLYAAQR
jgi:hypothetical protein